jgi:hypothetical protein
MTDKQSPTPLPLDRWIVALTRARRSQRLSELLNAKDADTRIATAPAPELFFAIKEAGLEDALPVLELCQPEQFQGFLDLGTWHDDAPDFEEAGRWLSALFAASKSRFYSVIPRLDEEWLLLFLRQYIEVFDSPDEAPDIPGEDAAVMSSPDGQDTLLIKETAGQGALAQAIIDAFFALDPLQGRRILEGIKAELDVTLEEDARRFRRGRLEDLGFLSREEALALYAPRDKNALLAAAAQRAKPLPVDAEFLRFAGLPAPYLAPLEAGGPLAELLGSAGAESLVPRVLAELPALLNRALSALQIDLADEAAIELVARHVRGVLDLGVGALGTSLARAELSKRTLVELFQLGWSRVLALKQRAVTLGKHPLAEWLGAKERAVVQALVGFIPRVSLSLATPPSEGVRLFFGEDDLRLVSVVVEDSEATLALLGLLQAAPETLRDVQAQHLGAAPFDAGSLFSTGMANALLGRAFSPAPLVVADLPTLSGLLFSGGEISLSVAEQAQETLAALPLGVQDAAQRVVSGWLRKMLDELSGLVLAPLPDPRFVGGVLLRRA